MADAVVLNAETRSGNGTSTARKLRKKGKVPVVVYGHKEATVSLTLQADELNKAIRHGARLVDLKHPGGVDKALIRDVQWNPVSNEIMHVDFARVSADERILVDVRLELRGVAPGVAAGGSLNQSLHSLHVECLAIAIPESIRVNIGELQLNQIIHVSDLKLPEGVIVKNDPEAIVVQISQQAAEAATTGLPGTESAEPEVIGKVKEEGEEAAE